MKNYSLVITFICALVLLSVVPSGHSQAQWVQTNGPCGGQVNALIVKGTSLYAGTGLSGTNLYIGTGLGGVFFSTNNGTSWTATGLTNTYVYALALSGANLFAGTSTGVFISTDNGGSWTQVNSGLTNTDVRALAVSGTNLFAGTSGGGVFLSTNNGTSWTAVNTGMTNNYVVALAVSGSSLFAGIMGGGVYLSTNNGTSWTAASTGLTPYVSTIAVSGSSLFAGTFSGVFLSTNNGSSWTAVNDGLTNNYVPALTVSGTNVFAGTNTGVFLSTNNGASWTQVNSGLTNTDVRALAVSPNGAGGTNLFAGTSFSGVFLSTNNGTNWTQVNSGLTNTLVLALAASGSHLFAGTNDGVFFSTNNGTNWTQVNSGLTNTLVLALAASGSNLFAGTLGGGVYLSTNNGTSWTAVNTGLTNTWVYANNCVFALAVSGSNLFAGTDGGGVYLSTNNGTSWRHPGLETPAVRALAVSGSNLFAGNCDGVLLSTNNGTSWTAINNGLTSNKCIQALAVSGTNLFAGTGGSLFGGSGGGGVFLSTNNGTSWTAVNTGLTNTWVYSLNVVGTNLFAGTYGGVFLSTNNGTSWTEVDNDLTSNNYVPALTVSGTNLFAGTGGGVWRRPLSEMVPSRGTTFTVTNNSDAGPGSLRAAILGANANPGADTINFSPGVTGAINLTSGELLITDSVAIKGPGANVLTVSGDSLTQWNVFVFSSGASSMEDLGISRTGFGYNAFFSNITGGVVNQSVLLLNRCLISKHSADWGSSRTSGIINTGTLTCNNVEISSSNRGIHNEGTMTLNDCSIHNISSAFGAGIWSSGYVTMYRTNITKNGGIDPGGMINYGTMILRDCTISMNSGDEVALFNLNAMTMINCTVSGNASKFYPGEPLLNSGDLELTNCTVTGNWGGFAITGGTLTLRNSIVALNHIFPPPSWGSDFADVSGVVTSQGHNLIGVADASSGWTSTDLTGTKAWPLDPMLGPLQDNGGRTQTHALLSCSPAINAGDNSVIGPPLSLSNDQRGFPRLVGSSVDMGSYESSITSCVPTLVCGLMHPIPNAIGVDKQTNISVAFRPSVNPSTLTGSTIKVYGLVSGFHTGAITYDPATRRATFTPGAGFKSGENVSVTLTTGITGVSGNSMQHPFTWGFTVASAVGSTSFQTSSQINVGSGPHSICAGDFDGDGDIDLAVTNGNTNTVSILRNDGSGTFTQVSTPTVGSSPRTVIAADVDGDGDLDLVVANNGSNTLSILKNNGSGTFTQTSAPSVGSGPYVVTAGDFDGDGDIDLAVVNYNGNTVSILKNNGSGTFSVTSTLAVGTNPYSLTAGDFDNDGMLDLAVVNEGSNNVYIYKNDGTGSFTYVSTVAVGTKPCSITEGDFDGDGSLDLAVGNYGSNTVSLLKNSGSGAFAQASAVAVGASPRFVTLGDFDGDGHLDLAVVNQGANTVSIVKNDGSGNFSQVSTPSVGAVPKTLVAAGLFGDGRLGLAVANSGANTISILRNTAAPNTVSVTLPDTIVSSSKTVELPVYVSDVTGMNILSYQLTVTFNSPNSILTASNDLVTTGTLSGASGWSALPNISVPNQITVGAFGANPLSGGGVLVKLKFTINPGTPTGQYSNLQFSNFIFNTGTPAATTANGKITARLLVCGDADENGSIQAYDAALTLREAIGPMPPPPPPLTAQGRINADVDMNGYVQAYDAALILRKVIGLSMPVGVSTCFSGFSKGVALESGPVNFNVSVASVQRDKVRTSAELTFKGLTPDAGIVAISFDVAMAEGADNGTSLAISGLSEDYMHTINRVDNEHFKVGIINPHGIRTDDIRMTIGASREESLKDIRITNILLNSTPAADIALTGTVANVMPTAYDLVGCYPNPFNPSTTIRYGIPVDATVNLAVYNTLGQKVAQLVEERMSAGYHDVVFDASQLSSGIYFYRLQAADFVATRKILLLR